MNNLRKPIGLFCLAASATAVNAEGIYQLDGANLADPARFEQRLDSDTLLFVHVNNPNDFIRFHLCGNTNSDNVSATIYATSQNAQGKYEINGGSIASLSSTGANINCESPLNSTLPATPVIGDQMQFQAPSSGVYAIEFGGTNRFERWDVAVVGSATATSDPTANDGNLFSYDWSFNTGSFDLDGAITTEAFVLVPGGFPNTHYVWALDLQNFSGYAYTLQANDIGLNAPYSGVSAPNSAGATTTEKYPTYLSYPAGANPNPAPVATQLPGLTDTLTFTDSAGNDNAISPDGDTIEESGNFTFTPDVSGTYAITIDLNRDGDFGAGDRLLLGTMEANTLSTVNWDGLDAEGNSIPQARYNVRLQLRVGEYHFVGYDVETSGGGTENGLTILQATDAVTRVPTTVYWDDETILGAGSNLPNGAMSSTALTGSHRHTWGEFDASGTYNTNTIGEQAYIDTYVFGNVSEHTVDAIVENQNAPDVTSNGGGYDALILVDENTTAVSTVTVANGTAPYTYSLAEKDAGLFSITPTGELTFNTAPNFDSPSDTDADNDYIIVVNVLDDNGFTTQQTITVRVQAVNEAPEADDQAVTVVENVAQAITLTGSDTENSPLTYTTVTAPANGVISGTLPNLTYTPAAGFFGSDSFTYTVNDGALDSTAATISITVQEDLDNDGIPDVTDPDDDGDGIDDSVESTGDTDGDGIPDSRDTDSDGDGISDLDEGAGDLDADGTPNYLDTSIDEDQDGIPDFIEGTADIDNDGVPNYLDIDSDNDGLIDGFEAAISGQDADSDGIDDVFDVDQTTGNDANNDGIDDDVALLDSDEDGTPNYLDIDSDNDLVPDTIEATMMRQDTDSDGIADTYDVDQTGGTDSDADGIDDTFDADVLNSTDANSDGVADALMLEHDHDADNIANYLDPDSDNDSIVDTVEADTAGVDSNSDGIDDAFDTTHVAGADTNNDGIVDTINLTDTDNDGVIDMFDLDSDNDGLLDTQEAPTTDVNMDGIADAGITLVTSPIDSDTDGVADYRDLDSNDDGTFDIVNGPHFATDANNDGRMDLTVDNDRDGIDDLVDVLPTMHGTGPLDDEDGDGIPSLLDRDDDNDGIADVTEAAGDFDTDNVNNHLDRDSDNDGLSDWFEANRPMLLGMDSDSDGIDDAFDADATGGNDIDGDGIDDSLTIPDTDGDGSPDYLDVDSDNDGINDNIEQTLVDINATDSDADGVVDSVDADALEATDSNNDGIADSVFNDIDFDNDGIPNFRDLDSDADGLSDSDEGAIDTDGDGAPNYLDVDSDEDGISDNEEGMIDTDSDTVPNYIDIDSDGDGISDKEESTDDLDRDNIPNYLDTDSDGDGVSDTNENSDFNGDGVVDRLQEDGKVETGVKGAGSSNVVGLLGLMSLALIRRRTKIAAAIVTAASLFSVNAQADHGEEHKQDQCAEEGSITDSSCWYIGAGLGYSRLYPEHNGTAWRVSEKNDTGFKVFAGVALSEHWFSELSYHKMGTAEMSHLNPAITNKLDVDYTAIGINAGYWLNERKSEWNAYGKIGVAVLDTQEGEYVEQSHGGQMTFGVGAQWHFTDNWFARLELDAIDKDARYIGLSISRYLGNTNKNPALKRKKAKNKIKEKALVPVAAPIVANANNTPKKSEVINNDLDNDGVLNAQDNCPNTASNIKVNNVGCPLLEKITLNLQFDTSSDVVKESYMAEIDSVSEKLKQYNGATIVVEGHTDSRGSSELNQKLSEARAASVAKLLKEKANLPADSITSVGLGESQPVADNSTKEGQYLNRRVEITIDNQ